MRGLDRKIYLEDYRLALLGLIRVRLGFLFETKISDILICRVRTPFTETTLIIAKQQQQKRSFQKGHMFTNISAQNTTALMLVATLSYDVASGSEISPCNKVDKPLLVYRFLGKVMTSITTLCT